MAFDWIHFLERHNVEFVTRGPNVGRGEIAVKCPLCGNADPSQHMSVNLQGKGWVCRRNAQHAGRSAAKLVHLLLRCSKAEAMRITGTDAWPMADDDKVSTLVRAALGEEDPTVDVGEPLSWPPSFHRLAKSDSPFAGLFWAYLWGRGYTRADSWWLAEQYDLAYCTYGDFAHRLIVPIHDEAGQVVSWTGRAVSLQKKPRYKSLKAHPIGEWILGLPLLWSAPRPEALFICEGPFDAMKVSALGRARGVYGTCLFGLNVSGHQVDLLRQLARRFPRVGCLLDEGAEMRVFGLQEQLGVPCPRIELPLDCDDPGELTRDDIGDLMSDLMHGVAMH